MARFSFDGYRRQWPRAGGVLAMAVGGATALAAGRVSKPRALSAANFGALLGFLASALLHVPIGITYIRAVHADRPLARAEWAAAIACTVISAAAGVAGPNLLMHDKNSPYAFTAAQMGHHDTQNPASDTAQA